MTYLYDGLLALDLEHLAFALGAVTEADIYDLSILWELHIVQDNERALDVQDGAIVDAGSDVVLCLLLLKMISHVNF